MTHTFEIGKVYAITSNGYKGGSHPASNVRCTHRTGKFATFRNLGAEKNGFLEETEKVKIRHTTSGNEMAYIFGGIISDTVYAEDMKEHN